jgi:hypothetical protein
MSSRRIRDRARSAAAAYAWDVAASPLNTHGQMCDAFLARQLLTWTAGQGATPRSRQRMPHVPTACGQRPRNEQRCVAVPARPSCGAAQPSPGWTSSSARSHPRPSARSASSRWRPTSVDRRAERGLDRRGAPAPRHRPARDAAGARALAPARSHGGEDQRGAVEHRRDSPLRIPRLPAYRRGGRRRTRDDSGHVITPRLPAARRFASISDRPAPWTVAA